MSRSKLTQQEIQELRENPYVIYVDEKRIIYSDEFKQRFIEEYMCNRKPSQIFRDAGFDVATLGSKRIERACYRWRESFRAGTLVSCKDAPDASGTDVTSGSDAEQEVPDPEAARLRALLKQSEEHCEYQRVIIDRLKEENKILKCKIKESR